MSFVPLRHQILAQMECNATNLNFALKLDKYLINCVCHLFGLQSIRAIDIIRIGRAHQQTVTASFDIEPINYALKISIFRVSHCATRSAIGHYKYAFIYSHSIYA